MKRTCTTLIAIVAFAIIALSGPGAQAARFRLHLERGILGFHHASTERFVEGDPEWDEESYLYKTTDNIFYFLMPSTMTMPMYNLGLGVELIPGLTLGARMGLGFQRDGMRDETDGEEEDKWSIVSFSYNVLPYLEYAFGNSLVRPFLMATLGVEGATVTYKEDDEGENYRSSDTATAFAFGGGGGLHVFPAEMVSIDFTVLAKFAVGTIRGESEYDGDVEKSDPMDTRHFAIDGILGLSLWL